MATGEPGTGAFAASAPMRSEFQDIEDGFDKMPLLTASTAVVVNGAGTALANTVGTLALAGNFATTGAFAVTLVAGAAVSITLPVVSGLTLATLTGAEILSNKTLVSPALGTPISGVATNLTGTAANLTAGSVTTNASLTGVITSVGNATTITSQTGTGTKFVVDTGPTIATPTFSGTISGNYSLGGTPTINVAAAVGGTWTAAATWTLPALTLGGTVSGAPTWSSNQAITLSTASQPNVTGLGTITAGVWHGTIVAGTYGGTGANNGSSAITVGDNFTVQGAFASTLILTAPTSLTLPTGGTLSTLTGAEAFTNKTYNGNTWTAGTGVLTIAASKTLTVSNTITLAGTDSTTITFPATSATVARTDAANTFTGVQTFSTPIATASVAAMTATVGGGVPTPPNNTTTFLRGDATFAAVSFAAFAAYTPVVSSEIGTITSYTVAAYKLVVGKLVFVYGTVTITNAGTGSGFLVIDIPAAALRAGTLYGTESGVTGKGASGRLTASGTTTSFKYDDAATIIATNAVLAFQGFYETA